MLASKGVNPVRTSANGTKKEVTAKDNAMEPKTQGVILLQSLLRFREPYNQVVIDRWEESFLRPTLGSNRVTIQASSPFRRKRWSP
jgi:hypothetical protein